MQKRIFIEETINKVGEDVEVAGWVNVRRDHGKIIFIDLRDKTGLLQVVFYGDIAQKADVLRSEWVLKIKGKIAQRPEKLQNPNLKTGKVELQAVDFEVLNSAKNLPFEIEKSKEVDEELRLKYRYLDLRNEKMATNLKLRHDLAFAFRQAFYKNGFIEIETPYLTKGTPEGSREFLVPARLHPGKFYVLPQSPQQFKQLLMVAGVERYFQVARCFRDEDQRGDRQPEFTQLDVEMSFVDQEMIMNLMEKIVIEVVKEIVPDKKMMQIPFPRISFKESMEKYGNDKPDLRKDKSDINELAFVWVVDFSLFEFSETEKKLVSAHHPFTHPVDEDMEMLEKEPEKVRAKAYDLVLNGFEVAGGSIRIHQRDLQNKIFEKLGLKEKEIVERFGHMLEAFEYGAPPHGGIAFGFDRLAAVFADEPNIREVIAFPKTGDARDPLMGSPAEVGEKELKEAHIRPVK
ncbi:MAG: Aspartyl-tRNA synthetase [Parcubacteria group bacterium GW2011_GWA2_39_18]|nr:MAG: Aspartyl-tRNA synthetase [Parcubacteria group bacterium GW2011_GWA2_39_18]